MLELQLGFSDLQSECFKLKGLIVDVLVVRVQLGDTKDEGRGNRQTGTRPILRRQKGESQSQSSLKLDPKK